MLHTVRHVDIWPNMTTNSFRGFNNFLNPEAVLTGRFFNSMQKSPFLSTKGIKNTWTFRSHWLTIHYCWRFFFICVLFVLLYWSSTLKIAGNIVIVEIKLILIPNRTKLLNINSILLNERIMMVIISFKTKKKRTFFTTFTRAILIKWKTFFTYFLFK